ncbi:MAG: iron ABC transporter permease [Maricaulaceae bacterium]|nr:iron ABC transporter permease [Maricaulaceae bacterium]
MALTASAPARERGRLSGLDPAPFAAAAALIAATPLFAVAAVAAFGDWSGGYLTHIAGTRLPVYLWNTLIVALVAAACAGAGGAVSAWIVARCDFPGRKIFEWALVLPLAVPAYVAAYAWLDITQTAGPVQGFLREASADGWTSLVPVVRGPVGAGFVFSFTFYPYVYLLARDAFAGQSADAYDAARTLGHGPVSAFRRAALPLARPAIAAGLALVVMEALADYGAVAHLGAPTLTAGVVRAWSGAGSVADAARLALLLVFIVLLVFGAERMQRRRARASSASGRRRPARRVRLTGWLALAAIGVCVTPLLLGFAIPLARLGWLALHAPVAQGLGQAFLNSVTLAGLAAVLAAVLGLGAAYALRSGRPFAVFAARAAGLGYAAPGAVAAVGVIAILAAMQGWLDQLWSGLGFTHFPILLTGGIGALIFAYLSRFAAAAIGPCESALQRVTPALDGAARTLGAGPTEVSARVHWPLVSGGVATAALLVFVEVIKELPATMILRPFNFDTLAVIAHNYAHDERLGQAAAPSVLLALAALGPMIWVARRIAREPVARTLS